ncbi:hypothetical protein [Salinisphaera sp. T31B1]|uniref:AtuA-related protein n=1 Tax=Salinisphaera sp. T31B1 TaxID=727963 RepID=UPI00333ED15E
MPEPDDQHVIVRLHELAHARAGDKGNRLNLAVFAYRDAWYDTLIEQVTEQRVAAWFAHRGATAVRRYPLPRLAGMNLVLDEVLQGGVNGALNLDGHGKTLSFRLLELDIVIDRTLLDDR